MTTGLIDDNTSATDVATSDSSLIEISLRPTESDTITVNFTNRLARQIFSISSLVHNILAYSSTSSAMSLLFLTSTTSSLVQDAENIYNTNTAKLLFNIVPNKRLPFGQARDFFRQAQAKVAALNEQNKQALVSHDEQPAPLAKEAAIYHFLSKVVNAKEILSKEEIRHAFLELMIRHGLNLNTIFVSTSCFFGEDIFYWINHASFAVPENKKRVLTVLYFLLLGIDDYTDEKSVTVNSGRLQIQVEPEELFKYLEADYLSNIPLGHFLKLVIACHFNSILPVLITKLTNALNEERQLNNRNGFTNQNILPLLCTSLQKCSLYDNEAAALILLGHPLASELSKLVKNNEYLISSAIIGFLACKMQRAAQALLNLTGGIFSVYIAVLAYYMIHKPQLMQQNRTAQPSTEPFIETIARQSLQALSPERPQYAALLNGSALFRDIVANNQNPPPLARGVQSLALLAEQKANFKVLIAASEGRFVNWESGVDRHFQEVGLKGLANHSLWHLALSYYANLGDADYFNILLQQGKFESTAAELSILHIAAWFGLTTVIEKLLGSEAYRSSDDYKKLGNPMFPVLDCAIVQGHLPVIDVLLKHGLASSSMYKVGYREAPAANEYTDYDQNSAILHQSLLMTVWNSRTIYSRLEQYDQRIFNIYEIFSAMLKVGLKPDMKRFSPSILHNILASAKTNGWQEFIYEKIQFWLKKIKENPEANSELAELFQSGKNKDGFSALDLAVLNGHIDVFKMLLKNGYRLTRLTDNNCPQPLLDRALYDPNVVESLIRHEIELPKAVTSARDPHRLLVATLATTLSSSTTVMLEPLLYLADTTLLSKLITDTMPSNQFELLFKAAFTKRAYYAVKMFLDDFSLRVTQIDEDARRQGSTLLTMLLRHCEYNPVSVCWVKPLSNKS